MKDATILLFTNSYPYSGAAEQTFIENELVLLQERYHRVALVPITRSGELRSYLPTLELDEGFSSFLENEERPGIRRYVRILRQFFSPVFYSELIKHPEIILNRNSVTIMLWWLLRARATEKWLKQRVSSDPDLKTQDIIMYTYWCSPVTLGAGFFCDTKKGRYAISRVLGSDLYEDQHENNYIPFRFATLKQIDRLFVVSDLGKKYLQTRYPAFSGKYTTSRIGVPDPGFLVRPSGDEIIRIVTCSYLVPVKRIDLLMDGLRILAEKRPDWEIHWTHIGNGPLKDELEKKAGDNMPSNLTCHFAGFIPSIYEYYQNHQIDIFMNTSKSEGIPVSVMEAESCGIPIIATAVGGNPEIVTEECGVLLSPDPQPDEIAEAIISQVSDRTRLQLQREGSRKKWSDMFDSYKNFSGFIREIDHMIDNPGTVTDLKR